MKSLLLLIHLIRAYANYAGGPKSERLICVRKLDVLMGLVKAGQVALAFFLRSSDGGCYTAGSRNILKECSGFVGLAMKNF